MDSRYRPRVAVESSVVFASGMLLGEGRVRNVSVPGCLLETPVRLRIGDYVQLRLALPDRQPALLIPLAAVRWVDDSRFGVEFIRTRERDRIRLNRFLEQQLHTKGEHRDWDRDIVWAG